MNHQIYFTMLSTQAVFAGWFQWSGKGFNILDLSNKILPDLSIKRLKGSTKLGWALNGPQLKENLCLKKYGRYYLGNYTFLSCQRDS